MSGHRIPSAFLVVTSICTSVIVIYLIFFFSLFLFQLHETAKTRIRDIVFVGRKPAVLVLKGSPVHAIVMQEEECSVVIEEFCV